MKQNRINIGIDALDKALEGGLQVGEIGLVIAPVYTNKSNWMRDYQQRLIETAKVDGYIVLTSETGFRNGEIEQLSKKYFGTK